MTQKEKRALTPADMKDLREIFATKEDLKRFATKEDLRGFVTKHEFRAEIDKLVTKEEFNAKMDQVFSILDAIVTELKEIRIEMQSFHRRLERLENTVFGSGT